MDNQTEKDKELLKMKEELLAQKQLNAANLIKIHEQRGVVATAEKEPLMKLALSDYDNTSKMLEARETPKQQPAKPDNIKLLAESLVTLHFERGAITAEQKGVYLKAAELDYEGTKKTLEGLRGKEIVNAMNFGSKPDEKKERVGWTYLDYYKKAPEALIAMEKDEPERYKKLCSDFEEESKKNNLNLD